MKKSGCLGYVAIVVFVVVCNLNLPPNDVAGCLDMSELNKATRAEKFFFGSIMKGMTADLIADWKYSNFVVLKIAESKRLGLVAVGFPFCKWKVGSAEEAKPK